MGAKCKPACSVEKLVYYLKKTDKIKNEITDLRSKKTKVGKVRIIDKLNVLRKYFPFERLGTIAWNGRTTTGARVRSIEAMTFRERPMLAARYGQLCQSARDLRIATMKDTIDTTEIPRKMKEQTETEIDLRYMILQMAKTYTESNIVTKQIYCIDC